MFSAANNCIWCAIRTINSIERDHSKLDVFWVRSSCSFLLLYLHCSFVRSFVFSMMWSTHLQHTINIIRCNDIINVRNIFHHCLRFLPLIWYWSVSQSVSQLIICCECDASVLESIRPIYHAHIYLSFSHRCCDAIILCSLECWATILKKNGIKKNYKNKNRHNAEIFNSYRHTKVGRLFSYLLFT